MARSIDFLISNQGYDCLVETIFANMDPITLARCRLVSKSWKDLIDNRKSLLIRQLQQVKQKKFPMYSFVTNGGSIIQSERKCSIIDQFQEWRQVFMDIERKANGHQLKIILGFMKNYSKHRRFPVGHYREDVRDSKEILMSPLVLAIKNGNEDFVKILMKKTKLDFQSTVQIDGQMFTTYLVLAVNLPVNNRTMVQLFLKYALEKGINLNLPDSSGRAAFHYACSTKLELVKLFMENVDEEFLQVNLLDRHGHSPLHYACIGNQPKIVQYLIDMSMQFSIDVNATDRNGHTLLHLAARYGYDNVAKVILEASLELEINTNAFDFENKTPFTIACINGHLEVAKLMIQQSRKYGIDLNLLDFQGNSAMYYAIKNKHLGIARVMIDESNNEGISLNQEDDFFVRNLLNINRWVNSVGGLVYGRRPDLWNPLIISYFFANQLIILGSMFLKYRYTAIIFMIFCYSLGFVLFKWNLLYDTVVKLDLFFNLNGYQLNSANEGFKEWLEIHLTMVHNQCHHQEFEKLKGGPFLNIYSKAVDISTALIYSHRFVILNVFDCFVCLVILAINYGLTILGIFIWLDENFPPNLKFKCVGLLGLLMCITTLSLVLEQFGTFRKIYSYFT